MFPAGKRVAVKLRAVDQKSKLRAVSGGLLGRGASKVAAAFREAAWQDKASNMPVDNDTRVLRTLRYSAELYGNCWRSRVRERGGMETMR